MKPFFHRIWLGLIVVAALFAGWRMVGQMQAERFAETEPERALRWRPDDPAALLALAERQLKQGNTQAAAATARHLLGSEPLHGRGFRVLAEAADREQRPAEALKLYEIAARRAPRDLPTRAWLTQHYLEQAQYPQALAQIDRILRMEPLRARSINPVLVQLAQDPVFAAALADALRADPPWRTGTLAALRDVKTGNPKAEGHVLQRLQDEGGLSDAEYKDWLDSLIAQGRWGEAYARWAGAAAKAHGRLPLVYNGDFSAVPGDQGFDWRVRRVPGVLLAFEPVGGTQGNAAYLRFLDRQIPEAGLEQPILLAPGRYRLNIRMRAEALRSQLGLEWVVVCAGAAGVVGRSEPVDGSFGWRSAEVIFTIPQQGCPGQWLRLINPIPAGAAQRAVGELWLDDVKITPHASMHTDGN